MVLAVVGVVIQAGTMNMQGIVFAQNDGAIFGWDGLGNPYVLTQFVGFVIFMIAVQAELTQTPFDMPIAESELVVRLHDRVLGLPLPDLLHRRVRHRRRLRRSSPRVLFLGGWGVPFSWFGWDIDRRDRRLDERHRAADHVHAR